MLFCNKLNVKLFDNFGFTDMVKIPVVFKRFFSSEFHLTVAKTSRKFLAKHNCFKFSTFCCFALASQVLHFLLKSRKCCYNRLFVSIILLTIFNNFFNNVCFMHSTNTLLAELFTKMILCLGIILEIRHIQCWLPFVSLTN